MTEPQLDILYTEDQIQARIKDLSLQIRRDYGDEPMVLIGVLKGSLMFLADLSRHLGHQVRIDFMQLSSYEGGTSSTGVVQIRKDLDQTIEGERVLIVEDIVDTGLTLAHLRELLMTRHPSMLRAVSLLRKPEAAKVEATCEYVGFEIPNQFVVGYGLDYRERFRNLPYIGILLNPD
ncbi:MAG TPA: hypoxanthine phosphoribosyltransferase [Fimbriimonadaceae bacterium]|nr:hypoxanthine phosphoribosyltransferase [Fimbriimonadaceae bacterium]HRJ33604.1 hypoxanthine phosphoribosyltransferase [Fimbriimonadaceae bacterium]